MRNVPVCNAYVPDYAALATGCVSR
jgi:hypothetical protein